MMYSDHKHWGYIGRVRENTWNNQLAVSQKRMTGTIEEKEFNGCISLRLRLAEGGGVQTQNKKKSGVVRVRSDDVKKEKPDKKSKGGDTRKGVLLGILEKSRGLRRSDSKHVKKDLVLNVFPMASARDVHKGEIGRGASKEIKKKNTNTGRPKKKTERARRRRNVLRREQKKEPAVRGDSMSGKRGGQ